MIAKSLALEALSAAETGPSSNSTEDVADCIESRLRAVTLREERDANAQRARLCARLHAAAQQDERKACEAAVYAAADARRAERQDLCVAITL